MAIWKSITHTLRSSTCRTLLFALATLLVLTLLSLITISTPSTVELLADDIPLEGHQACQACLDGADAAWWNCVQTEAGGDVGDADCSDKRSIAINGCQNAYCNQTAEAKPARQPFLLASLFGVFGEIAPTAECSVLGFCDSCNAQTDEIIAFTYEQTGSDCRALRAGAVYCSMNCPTCSFCDNHIQNVALLKCNDL
jgi:hypothetical protein